MFWLAAALMGVNAWTTIDPKKIAWMAYAFRS